MIEYSIPTIGFGPNGSIYEILTLGYPLTTSRDTLILVFNVIISQDIELELIR